MCELCKRLSPKQRARVENATDGLEILAVMQEVLKEGEEWEWWADEAQGHVSFDPEIAEGLPGGWPYRGRS